MNQKAISSDPSLRHLLTLGDLDALRQYIAADQPLRIRYGPGRRLKSAIEFATEIGFYSQLKLLLEATTWSDTELQNSMAEAVTKRRPDLVRLLFDHNASVAGIDPIEVLRSMDMDLIQQFIDRGMDPCEDNAFTKVLAATGAKPLLRFYKEHCQSIPGLQEQICKALVLAINSESARWISLLIWAGTDIHREVELPLFGFDDKYKDTYCTTGLEALIGLGDLHLMEALKIPVDDALRQRMLDCAARQPEDAKFEEHMKRSTVADLNSGERGGCPALEDIVNEHSHDLSIHLPGFDGRKEQRATLMRVDILLDAGARWLPSTEKIKNTRRSLLTHDGGYLSQLLRKLVYTPETSTIDDIWELCRTKTIQRKLSTADPVLWEDICRMACIAKLKGVPRAMRLRKGAP